MFSLKSLFRRRLPVLLGLMSMLMLVTFSACNSSSNTAADSSQNGATVELPKEFRIGYQLSAGPETLVKELGLMEEKFPQVEIRWQAYDSGRNVTEAIAQGVVDVGLTGSVPASMGIAKEVPYKVYFIMNILGDNEALAVTEEANIATTTDLADKIIAVPFGSTTHFSLLAALDQDGVDPNDLQILDMQPQEILDAWQFGEIDGGFIWQPTLARMLDEGGSILVSARTVAEKGAITADLGVVSIDFSERYPDFLQAYAGALDAAINLYRDEPKIAAEAMSEVLALSLDESLAVMNELVWLSADEQRSEKYLGTPDAPGALSQVLKDSAEFMVTQGEMPSAPSLEIYEQALFNGAIVPADP